MTKGIDRISNQFRGHSVCVLGPIVETRRQVTKDYFTSDLDALDSARFIFKKAIHELYDNHLNIVIAENDQVDVPRIKVFVDSLLENFLAKKYDRFWVNRKRAIDCNADLTIIPYLIWTRTTPEFEQEKCGLNGGRTYAVNPICTWTRSQTMLLVVNKATGEVLYFKYKQWDIDRIYMPYKDRITKSLKRCSRPILRKLGSKKKH